MPVSEQGIFTDRYTQIPRALIFVTREELCFINQRLTKQTYLAKPL